jgi:hypothetical protein
MNDHGLKDTGLRETFPSGAQREPDTGRGRYDLISPIAMRNLAIHLERGALKYEPHGWEKGLPLSRHLNSALRHLHQFQEGIQDEDHISAVVFNLFAITHVREMIRRGKLPTALDDLPSYMEDVK